MRLKETPRASSTPSTPQVMPKVTSKNQPTLFLSNLRCPGAAWLSQDGIGCCTLTDCIEPRVSDQAQPDRRD